MPRIAPVAHRGWGVDFDPTANAVPPRAKNSAVSEISKAGDGLNRCMGAPPEPGVSLMIAPPGFFSLRCRGYRYAVMGAGAVLPCVRPPRTAEIANAMPMTTAATRTITRATRLSDRNGAAFVLSHARPSDGCSLGIRQGFPAGAGANRRWPGDALARSADDELDAACDGEAAAGDGGIHHDGCAQRSHEVGHRVTASRRFFGCAAPAGRRARRCPSSSPTRRARRRRAAPLLRS